MKRHFCLSVADLCSLMAALISQPREDVTVEDFLLQAPIGACLE